MKKLMFAAFAACLSILSVAETNAPTSTARRRRPSRPNGGLLERREAIPSKQVGIANLQKVVAGDKVARAVARARVITTIPLVLGDGNSPAKIDLVERDDATTLTINPEDFKAIVNVKALAADGATADVVEARLRKEVVRAGFFLMGSGSTLYDVTKPIVGLKDLDGLTENDVSAETVVHMNCKAKAGVRTIRFSTYRQACREGWAPTPTNDVQKAIWDEIHKLPTAPLKIKPETKKVTE